MAKHRSQAQFERAKWTLLILAPGWVLQSTITTTLMGMFAWNFGITLREHNEKNSKSSMPTLELTWEGANVFMSLIATVATLIEMIRFWGECLKPSTMLYAQATKLICSSVITSLDIVALVVLKDEHYSIISLCLDSIFLAVSFGLLIYALKIHRRVSGHDHYARPSNVKPFGYNDGLEPDRSPSGRLSISILDNKRSSFSSIRRLSTSSLHPDAAKEIGTVERTPSYYSHRRDTQFDEYVARRASMNSTRDIEAAVDVELDDEGRTREINLAQQDRDVHQPSEPALSRPADQPARTISTTSDHVLVAVPEEEDEIAEDEDKQTLLVKKQQRTSPEMDSTARWGAGIGEPRWRRLS